MIESSWKLLPLRTTPIWTCVCIICQVTQLWNYRGGNDHDRSRKFRSSLYQSLSDFIKLIQNWLQVCCITLNDCFEGQGSRLSCCAEDVTVNAEADDQPIQKANRTQQMTLRERWSRTYALWPYMIPLVLVYFAEYSMQVKYSQASPLSSRPLAHIGLLRSHGNL